MVSANWPSAPSPPAAATFLPRSCAAKQVVHSRHDVVHKKSVSVLTRRGKMRANSTGRTNMVSQSNYYTGLFLIIACTLMLQVIQTRVLSVVAWSQLAFLRLAWRCWPDP